MVRKKLFALSVILACGLLAPLGCDKGDTVVTGCEYDSDCGDPLSHRCDVATRTCLCRNSDACPDGQACNSAGYCQAVVGCFTTDECPHGYFCDPGINTCLERGRCANDLHCGFGQVCDASTHLCRDGCRSHGDCQWGAACRCGDGDCACDALDEEGRLACAIGSCDDSRCVSSDYCAYGETCLPDLDGKGTRCQSDYDVASRPYCDSCVSGVAGGQTCGNGPNFCLYSTYTGTTFCGADCSGGQACPNGFECDDVIVVWMSTACSDSSDCRREENRSDIPCVTSADCPNSALCDTDSGYCYGACIRSEGSSQSFCACVEDDDCAQDSCDPVTRTCTTSRKACDPALDNCPKIRCVDFGNKGGCLIGQNCAPREGLTCEDMGISR